MTVVIACHRCPAQSGLHAEALAHVQHHGVGEEPFTATPYVSPTDETLPAVSSDTT